MRYELTVTQCSLNLIRKMKDTGSTEHKTVFFYFLNNLCFNYFSLEIFSY